MGEERRYYAVYLVSLAVGKPFLVIPIHPFNLISSVFP